MSCCKKAMVFSCLPHPQDSTGHFSAPRKLPVVHGPGTPSTRALTQPPYQSPCKALKPWSGTRVEPVTNCSSRALLSSSKASTACQNHLTMLLSAMQCFRRVLDFQSLKSILSRPPIMS